MKLTLAFALAAAALSSAAQAAVTYDFVVAPILDGSGRPLSTVDSRTFTFQISGPANFTGNGRPEYRAYSYSYTEFGSTTPVVVPATPGKNVQFFAFTSVPGAAADQGGLGLTNSGNRNFAIYNTSLYDEAAFRANPALEPVFRVGSFALSTTPWNNTPSNSVPRPQDNYVVTISVAGAVPEPAGWAMMIGGFALTGGALRRRSAIAAAA